MYMLRIQSKNEEDLEKFLSWLKHDAEYSFYNYLYDDGWGVVDNISNTYVFDPKSSILTVRELKLLPEDPNV